MKTKTLALLSIVALALCWRAEAQIYDTNGDYVETFVGSGIPGYLDGQGQLTEFSSPSEIVADAASNLYVWDSGNARIRKITPSGMVSTFVGGGTQFAGFGTNVSLSLYSIGGMVVDHANTIWIGASYYGEALLLNVSTNGEVSEQMGGLPNFSGGSGFCFDSANNLYYSGGNRIYIYNPSTEAVGVFVGSGVSGHLDGNGIFTEFSGPSALVCDQANNIYAVDSSGLRKIDQSLNVTTITNSLPGTPITVDNAGNIICANGSAISKLTATTNVFLFAGTASYPYTGYVNGPGNVARFSIASSGISSVCLSQGMIFIADSGNQRIRSIRFNPVAEPVTGPNLGIATYAGITITGLVGRTYQVQASADMTTWNTVETLLLTSSPYLWFDTNSVVGSKFYRAFLMP